MFSFKSFIFFLALLLNSLAYFGLFFVYSCEVRVVVKCLSVYILNGYIAYTLHT